MSNNAPPSSATTSTGGTAKRAVLPKQLEKLDVALEREKSVRARQSNNGKASAAAKYGGSHENNNNSRTSSIAGAARSASPELNATSSSSSAQQAREKSPSKQQQQRASVNKVAVAAPPSKRPASAPVKPIAKSAGVKPVRASIVGGASGVGDASVKPIEVKPRKATLNSNDGKQSDGDDGEAADGDENGGGALDEEQPARGHYDIFIQTRQCEDVCLSLGLTLPHIRRMKKLYDANDMYCTGEITQAEFFFMINEEERPISKGIFKFGGIAKDQKYISFDQYLLCVVQFASLTKPELFQYVFDLYDDDLSGSLDEHEFTKMSKELQSKQFCFPKNVGTAIKMLGGTDGGRGVGTDDGLVDIAQFMKFARNFPVAFYPIVNMQKNIRAATLGESFWSWIVARKLKIQQLLVYMRRNYGAIPDMTLRERISSFFSNDVYYIRKRAGELYATEVMQGRLVGEAADG